MWLALPQWKQALKWVAFTISKGLAYRYVNSRAVHAYGYTPDTITRLRGFFGSTPADVLPLAYDADRFFHDADLRRATRSQLGLREDDVLVITVGKFQRYKGIEDIVEAVDRTSRQDVNLRVLLVGADSSEYSDEIRAMVAGRDQDAVPVEVLDFRDAESLNALYNAADIGVWPRLPAISIQQAMGTGLFVVLPQNQWVGHLVEPGTGKYFEAELGIEGLARALDEYSGADRTDERRDERARRNSRFSGDGIARQVLEHVGLSH
nr:glycosyltransferase [Nocardioides lijunqiniae]